MQAINYSAARNNLRQLIDDACNDYEEFVITTKDSKQAVLISYDEFASMKETLYLLTSQINRERLLDSVQEINEGRFQKKELLK